MLLRDLLTQCQADATAGIFVVSVQTLKQGKDQLAMLRSNADAVVRHRKDPLPSMLRSGNVNHRCVSSAELERICQEILKQLQYLGTIGHNSGKLSAGYSCIVLIHHRAQAVDRILKNQIAVRQLRGASLPAQARERQ